VILSNFKGHLSNSPFTKQVILIGENLKMLQTTNNQTDTYEIGDK
jgi:hypothetical protein